MGQLISNTATALILRTFARTIVGGVSSRYNSLELIQYTEPESHAAVEAAANWGTYVAVTLEGISR
jgi:imidazolonepropionase-like amidohydrolase